MIVAVAALMAMPLALQPAGPATILIVADEMPAMRVLAEQIHSLEAVDARIVDQGDIPADSAAFDAIVVYIHGQLQEQAEAALLRYADEGGKLILLHHSISSGKRRNQNWFSRLGIALPEGDVERGGYKWIEGVPIEIACLAPRHFITSNRLVFPGRVAYHDARGVESLLPGFRLPHSEVYLNHRLTGRRTTLLGLRFSDPATGKVWTQPTAGWTARLGKGHVVYLMPGHSVEEFRDPTYARLVANAVIWQP